MTGYFAVLLHDAATSKKGGRSVLSAFLSRCQLNFSERIFAYISETNLQIPLRFIVCLQQFPQIVCLNWAVTQIEG